MAARAPGAGGSEAPAPMAGAPAVDPADPMSPEALTLRHANRTVLLQRLGQVRGQVQELEREIGDIERTVRALPYAGPQHGAAGAPPPQAPRCGFFANAAAGGIALPLAIGCMHPLDTVRTVMQAALHREQDFLRAASSLGWRGFVRGIGPSIVWACPQGAIRLGCYELSKEMLAERQELGSPLGAARVSASAVAADVASSVVKVPRELVTQRMQTGRYATSLGALRGIVREDGVLGLFRGYASTCLRDAPFVALLFISYEQFKTWKIRLVVADDGPGKVFSPWSSAETVLWGGVSGGIAAFLTTPFDVVKTRIMTANTALTTRQAAREIGPYGLFAGAGPRNAWWFCVSSIFFASYERLRLSIQSHVDAGGEARP